MTVIANILMVNWAFFFHGFARQACIERILPFLVSSARWQCLLLLVSVAQSSSLNWLDWNQRLGNLWLIWDTSRQRSSSLFLPEPMPCRWKYQCYMELVICMHFGRGIRSASLQNYYLFLLMFWILFLQFCRRRQRGRLRLGPQIMRARRRQIM